MEKFQRENILTWMIFLFFVGIANTLNIIWRFVIINEQYAETIDYISIILVYTGIFIKILNIERSINRSNFYKGYFFSIILMATIIYAIVANPIALKEFSIFQIIFLILMIASFTVFPGIFLYLSLKSTGDARKNAFMVVIGSLALAGGLLLQPQNTVDYADMLAADPELLLSFFTILCPILTTIGVILMFSSYRKTL